MDYGLNLSKKDVILYKLRIIYPTINWEDLCKLYYVYQSSDYKKTWVNEGITPNLNCSTSLEQRLEEKGLIFIRGQKPNSCKKIKGIHIDVEKILNSQLGLKETFENKLEEKLNKYDGVIQIFFKIED